MQGTVLKWTKQDSAVVGTGWRGGDRVHKICAWSWFYSKEKESCCCFFYNNKKKGAEAALPKRLYIPQDPQHQLVTCVWAVPDWEPCPER